MSNEPTHLDLFSGIGGFALAAQWAGFRTVGFCEISPFCCRHLQERFPGIPNFGDITSADFYGIGRVDLLTGGFPCQPFSQAGLKRGKADHRNLWPAMLQVVERIRPGWVLGENVAHFSNLGLDGCLDDLAAIGYQSQALDIPSCAVGLPSVERHVWIVAARDGIRVEGDSKGDFQRRPREHEWNHLRSETGGFRWDLRQPYVLRSRKGVPDYVDRITALGNAIVPQVAYQILREIRRLIPCHL